MEYKFRGKRIDNGEWVYGWLHQCHSDKQTHIMPGDCVGCNFCSELGYSSWLPVHPASVGMWTGLKDKAGVEIYEGDVVKHQIYNPTEVKSIQSFERMKIDVERYQWQNSKGYGFEVIGNIHENLELLESK